MTCSWSPSASSARLRGLPDGDECQPRMIWRRSTYVIVIHGITETKSVQHMPVF